MGRQTDGEHIKSRIIYPASSPSAHIVGKMFPREEKLLLMIKCIRNEKGLMCIGTHCIIKYGMFYKIKNIVAKSVFRSLTVADKLTPSWTRNLSYTEPSERRIYHLLRNRNPKAKAQQPTAGFVRRGEGGRREIMKI